MGKTKVTYVKFLLDVACQKLLNLSRSLRNFFGEILSLIPLRVNVRNVYINIENLHSLKAATVKTN